MQKIKVFLKDGKILDSGIKEDLEISSIIKAKSKIKLIDFINNGTFKIKEIDLHTSSISEVYMSLEKYISNYFSNIEEKIYCIHSTKSGNRIILDQLGDKVLSEIFNFYSIFLYSIESESNFSKIHIKGLKKPSSIFNLKKSDNNHLIFSKTTSGIDYELMIEFKNFLNKYIYRKGNIKDMLYYNLNISFKEEELKDTINKGSNLDDFTYSESHNNSNRLFNPDFYNKIKFKDDVLDKTYLHFLYSNIFKNSNDIIYPHINKIIYNEDRLRKKLKYIMIDIFYSYEDKKMIGPKHSDLLIGVNGQEKINEWKKEEGELYQLYGDYKKAFMGSIYYIDIINNLSIGVIKKELKEKLKEIRNSNFENMGINKLINYNQLKKGLYIVGQSGFGKTHRLNNYLYSYHSLGKKIIYINRLDYLSNKFNKNKVRIIYDKNDLLYLNSKNFFKDSDIVDIKVDFNSFTEDELGQLSLRLNKLFNEHSDILIGIDEGIEYKKIIKELNFNNNGFIINYQILKEIEDINKKENIEIFNLSKNDNLEKYGFNIDKKNDISLSCVNMKLKTIQPLNLIRIKNLLNFEFS